MAPPCETPPKNAGAGEAAVLKPAGPGVCEAGVMGTPRLCSEGVKEAAVRAARTSLLPPRTVATVRSLTEMRMLFYARLLLWPGRFREDLGRRRMVWSVSGNLLHSFTPR